jgi:hypothetical protein
MTDRLEIDACGEECGWWVDVEYEVEPGMPATGDGWHEPRYEATHAHVAWAEAKGIDGPCSCAMCGEPIDLVKRVTFEIRYELEVVDDD